MGPGGDAAGTVLHLGEGGFDVLNGWSDAGYGNVPTKLVRIGPIAMLYGVVYAPADFAGGTVDVLKLPDLTWWDDFFGIIQPLYGSNPGAPAESIGGAWLFNDAGEVHLQVQGLPDAASRPGLVTGDGLALSFHWVVSDPA